MVLFFVLVLLFTLPSLATAADFSGTITFSADKPVAEGIINVVSGENVNLTAHWITNRDVTHSEWVVNGNSLGITMVPEGGVRTNGSSTYTFNSTPGMYVITFNAIHHNKNQGDRVISASVTVIVCAPPDLVAGQPSCPYKNHGQKVSAAAKQQEKPAVGNNKNGVAAVAQDKCPTKKK